MDLEMYPLDAIYGYSLAPSHKEYFFELADIKELVREKLRPFNDLLNITHFIGDVGHFPEDQTCLLIFFEKLFAFERMEKKHRSYLFLTKKMSNIFGSIRLLQYILTMTQDIPVFIFYCLEEKRAIDLSKSDDLATAISVSKVMSGKTTKVPFSLNFPKPFGYRMKNGSLVPNEKTYYLRDFITFLLDNNPGKKQIKEKNCISDLALNEFYVWWTDGLFKWDIITVTHLFKIAKLDYKGKSFTEFDIRWIYWISKHPKYCTIKTYV